MRFVLLVVLIAACGGPKASTDAAPSDVNISACGSIGKACGAGCASGLECVENVCMPVRGDCGGFAGAPCQDTTLECTYPMGSSGGICMRPDEKACVCAIAPTALGDCVQAAQSNMPPNASMMPSRAL